MIYARQDHLHIRGEYELLSTPDEDPIGSPPHTWRILALNMYDRVNVEDHLHIRGEYGRNSFDSKHDLGSPPHTWRILESGRSSNLKFRITSTYVENTINALVTEKISWDHLHIRGEYLTSGYFMNLLRGSPPHTWRILQLKPIELILVRITTTYVENTIMLPWDYVNDEDHLHIRGEYLLLRF